MRTELKKMLVTVSLLVFVSTGFMALDANGFDKGIEGKILSVNGVTENNLNITVKNDASDIIFEKRFRKVSNHYSKKLDLSQLPEGNYTVEVENDYTVEIYQVNINASDLTVQEDNKVVIFKPQVVQHDGFVDIGLEVTTLKPITLTIFNRGKVLMTKKFDQNDIAQRLDVSKLSEGSYFFRFTSEGMNFTKEVIIK